MRIKEYGVYIIPGANGDVRKIRSKRIFFYKKWR
jgi:hypothetical protein